MSLSESELLDIQEKVCSFGTTYDYTLTPSEMEWFYFVRGRYSIHDFLNEHTISTKLVDGVECITVRLYSGLSEALDNDCGGFGKAVCLSDDTDLQRILFYCYQSVDELS